MKIYSENEKKLIGFFSTIKIKLNAFSGGSCIDIFNLLVITGFAELHSYRGFQLRNSIFVTASLDHELVITRMMKAREMKSFFCCCRDLATKRDRHISNLNNKWTMRS